MLYNSHLVPVRADLYDAQGKLTRAWLDFFGSVSRKAGRSALWRGVYDAGLQYAVCDVVAREDDGSLWIAQQAQPIDGRGAVAPGEDLLVWDYMLTPIPAGGEEGQVLTKTSDEDFETEWTDTHYIPAGGTDGQVLTKVSDEDYDAEWEDPTGGGGAVDWGDIGGTLSDQTDLQTALDAKFVDPTTTKGDLIARGASAPATRLPVGSDGHVLTADAASVLGVKWAPATGGGGAGSGEGFAWGGDGSDGTVTFDGAATVLGMVPASSVYTMSRDICCIDITVNAGVTIKTANYAIFATGTATINGTVHNDGQNANNGASPTSSTGGNGGTAGLRSSSPTGNDGHYPRLIGVAAGGVGGSGATGAGSQAAAANAGGSVTSSTPLDHRGVAGSNGSSGGKGGTGTSGAGGALRAGGTGGVVFTANNWQTGRNPTSAVTGVGFNIGGATATAHPIWASNAAHGGAAGGSGGGGDGVNAGGGGGGGGGEGGSGGALAICAATIIVGATGIVRANGGNGGNGGNGRTPTIGNCGGGGGGGGGAGGVGGVVWLVYQSITNSGTVQANGGSAGTGGSKGSPSGTGTDNADPGQNGSTGPAGNVVMLAADCCGGGGGGETVDWGEIAGTLSSQTDLQSAIDAKLDDSQIDTDGTLAANSDAKIASQKAVKTYVTAHAGMADPTTTKGDVIARGSAAPATRLPVGSDGQVLTADAVSLLGVKWSTPAAAGMSDPTTTKGDLIARGSAAPATRLPAGSDGQVLTVDAAQALGVKWSTPASGGMADPTTTKGDLVARGSSAPATRLPVGSDGQVLTADAASSLGVKWSALAAGVPPSRQINTSTGLTGGGDLSADRTLSVVDDTTVQRVRVSDAGSLIASRREINFVEGTNVTLGIADDAGNNRVNVTVSAASESVEWGEIGGTLSSQTDLQSALNAKLDDSQLDTDTSLAANSDSKIATQKATKAYVDAHPTGMTDPTTTKGDIIARGASAPATRLPVGSDGQVLTADAASTLGVKWATAAGGGSQTPWTTDIDGDNHSLSDVNGIACKHLEILGPGGGETGGPPALVKATAGIGLLVLDTADAAKWASLGFFKEGVYEGEIDCDQDGIQFWTNAADPSIIISHTGDKVGFHSFTPAYPVDITGDLNVATGVYRKNGVQVKQRIGHTWGLVGDVSALTTLPSIFVPIVSPQTTVLASIRAKIASGTSVGVQVKRNGSNVGSVITVTSTAATTSLGNVALTDMDELTIALSSPSGTPTTLSATLVLEHA